MFYLEEQNFRANTPDLTKVYNNYLKDKLTKQNLVEPSWYFCERNN